MAQLVERYVRIVEASGSNPLTSTSKNLKRTTLFGLGFFFTVLQLLLLATVCKNISSLGFT